MKSLLVAFMLIFNLAAMADDHLKEEEQARAGSPVEAPATQLDDLIRGEMSAVKSYDQVIKKMESGEEKKKLEALRKDHVDAVATLKSYATSEIKEETETAGPWGTFAKSYTGGASLFGNKAAMGALKQGEKHGVNEYEEALNDESIKPELKSKIRGDLLPKQKKHIDTINSFM